MISRETFFFGAAIFLLAVAAFAFWAFFIAFPYTFRSDCRQTGPNEWVCDKPAFGGPVPSLQP
jgi:hypothetical protein